MYNLVTSVDEKYYPALVALSNSVKENAGDDISLHCIAYGDDGFIEKCRNLDINVIANPRIEANIPTTRLWPVPSEAMYARLLVPHLFDDNCAWIDADCVVLDKVNPLFKAAFPNPIAAVGEKISCRFMREQIGGNIGNLSGVRAFFSGLIVFNVNVWREKNITEQCFRVMETRKDLDFYFAVQSVLNYVIRGNFHCLEYLWQVHANRGPMPSDTKILHFVGGLPWRDSMHNVDVWNQYK